MQRRTWSAVPLLVCATLVVACAPGAGTTWSAESRGGPGLEAGLSPRDDHTSGASDADQSPPDETSPTTPAPTGVRVDGVEDLTGEWDLISAVRPGGEFVADEEDSPPHLTIGEPDAVLGHGGCAGFGGNVAVTDGVVEFSPMVRPASACLDPDGTIYQRGAALGAIGYVDAGWRDGDVLILTGANTELTFVRVGDPPPDMMYPNPSPAP